MVKVNVPCSECHRSPIDRLDLVDGEIWICPHCGHQEWAAGVDVEAQLAQLAAYDRELADGWREALGL